MPCSRCFLITRSHLNNWQAFRSLCQARDTGCAAGWTLSARNHALNVEIVAEIDGLALLMRAVRDGLGATLQPGAAISHLDNDALRVIGVHNPVLSRPNFLVSLSDDELTPAGLAARVVLTKVMRQLVDAGEWPGATLYAY